LWTVTKSQAFLELNNPEGQTVLNGISGVSTFSGEGTNLKIVCELEGKGV